MNACRAQNCVFCLRVLLFFKRNVNKNMKIVIQNDVLHKCARILFFSAATMCKLLIFVLIVPKTLTTRNMRKRLNLKLHSMIRFRRPFGFSNSFWIRSLYFTLVFFLWNKFFAMNLLLYMMFQKTESFAKRLYFLWSKFFSPGFEKETFQGKNVRNFESKTRLLWTVLGLCGGSFGTKSNTWSPQYRPQ